MKTKYGRRLLVLMLAVLMACVQSTGMAFALSDDLNQAAEQDAQALWTEAEELDTPQEDPDSLAEELSDDSLSTPPDIEQLEMTEAEPEPGEIVVVYEEGCNRQEEEEILETLDESCAVENTEELTEETGDMGDAVLVQLSCAEDTEEAIEELEETDGVAFAQPNYQYNLQTIADTYSSRQYYLNGWDKTFKTKSGANVAAAQKQIPAGSHVTVAVFDTGCDTSHPDLVGNLDLEHAYNSITHETGASQVVDTVGHGTHVTGIIGAVAGNNTGIAGVAGNCVEIIPVKVFEGGYCSTSSLVAAFSYINDLNEAGEIDNLRVINLSLGGYISSRDYATEAFISHFRQQGVLSVCAGGNGDEHGNAYKDKYISPGDFEDSLCVTALTADGCNARYSDYNKSKDISAPGSDIYSTYPGNYVYMSGTSMATPVVSAGVALLWAYNDQLSCDQVVQIIRASAHPVNKKYYNRSGYTGSAGAIDINGAINYSKKFDSRTLGRSFKYGSNTYVITKVADITTGSGTPQVSLLKTTDTKKNTVPSVVNVYGFNYTVTGIKPNAYSGKKKLKTLYIKAKYLNKANLRYSLSGSSVKTVYVRVGTKAENKRYVSVYKPMFAKGNSGRKVKVKK